MLTAGLHGNEINGIEIVRAAYCIEFRIRTRNRCSVPVVNIYGFFAAGALSAGREGFKRSFPETKTDLLPSGGLCYSQLVLPIIDVGVDFHTGGASKDNYPQTRCVLAHEDNRELAAAFSAPFTLNSPLIDRSFRKASHRRGKSIIVYEAASLCGWHEQLFSMASMVPSLMKWLGMKSNAPQAILANRVLEKRVWAYGQGVRLFAAEQLQPESK